MRNLYIALTAICLLSSNQAYADCPAAPLATASDMVISMKTASGVQVAPGSTMPSTVKEGMVVYDDANDTLKLCDGTNWVSVGAAGGTASSAGAAGYLQFSDGAGSLAYSGTTAGQQLFWDNTTKSLGIGTATPSAKAILDVSSTTKGFLPPRMNTAQRDAITSPALGLFVFNTTTNQLEFYNGTGWTSVSGMTTGTITAFAATTCPVGWTEYTLARGRFLRGIDSSGSTTIDPAGLRAPGHLQNEDWKSFQMTNTGMNTGAYSHGPVDMGKSTSSFVGNMFTGYWAAPAAAIGLKWNTEETRPDNVAVIYCQYTGSGGSGGSGGSTTLVGLTDTNIVSPANGHALVYNSGSAKWESQPVYGSGGDNPSNGAVGYVQLSGGSGTFAHDSSADNHFFWNSSTHNLGVGTNIPSAKAIVDLTSTTKGFLPPRMNTTQRDAITSPPVGLTIYNTTTNQLNIYNGSSWYVAGSATTSVVTFMAVKTGMQNGATDGQVVTWQSEPLDIGGGFDTAQSRFTAPVAGYYYLHADILSGNGASAPDFRLYKNGANTGWSAYGSNAAAAHRQTTISGVIQLNVGDYVDIRSAGTNDVYGDGGAFHSRFSGFLLNGNNAGSGVTTLTGLTDTNIVTPSDGQALAYNSGTSKWSPKTFSTTMAGLNDINVSGAANGQSLVYNSTTGKWEPQTLANSSGGGGTNPAVGTAGHVQISAGSGVFSAATNELFWNSGNSNLGIGTATPNAKAALDITSTTKGFLPPRMTTVQRDAITAPAAGLFIYNTTTSQLEFFNGSVWASVSGMANGTIAAFASATCPTGWSEYMAARGRFLRGIDSSGSTAVDPSGLRAPGNTQADATKNQMWSWFTGGTGGSTGNAFIVHKPSVEMVGIDLVGSGGWGSYNVRKDMTAAFDATYGAAAETRPKNVAVIYCRYDGAGGGGGGGGITTLAGLTDVDLTGLSNGKALVYNNTSSKWEAQTIASGATALAALTDINVAGVTDGQSLVYDTGTGNWVPQTITSGVSTLAALTDTNIASATNGQSLVYNSGSGKWEPQTISGGGGGGSSSGASGYLQLSGGAGSFASDSSAGNQLFWNTTNHNLGIGTATPSSTAILELASTTKGLLLPRMNTTQRNAISLPATGLTIYNTVTGSIEFFNGSAWTSTSLTDGDKGDITVSLTGTSWILDSSAFATGAQFRNATTNKALEPSGLWSAAQYVTLTDAASIAIDFNAGINYAVTLGGNRTLANPSNAKPGQSGIIRITQDGIGSRTLSYGTAYKWSGGNAGVLTTTAGRVDYLFYTVFSNSEILLSLVKDVR